MGYYSEIGIALYTKDYKTMVKRAKALKKQDTYKLINYADKYIADEGKVTILYFANIKWYSNFEDVRWIETFIQKVDAAFVRTGEDTNDNEEDYYNDGYELLSYCYLTRKVEIDGKKLIEEDENLNELLDEIDRRL